MKDLDLRIVADCRWYLANFRVNGRQVLFAELLDGSVVEFATCTDEQAINMANQLYQDIELPAEIARAKGGRDHLHA